MSQVPGESHYWATDFSGLCVRLPEHRLPWNTKTTGNAMGDGAAANIKKLIQS
jgi:hypothetical protein